MEYDSFWKLTFIHTICLFVEIRWFNTRNISALHKADVVQRRWWKDVWGLDTVTSLLPLSSSNSLCSYVAVHLEEVRDEEMVCITLSTKWKFLIFIFMLLMMRMNFLHFLLWKCLSSLTLSRRRAVFSDAKLCIILRTWIDEYRTWPILSVGVYMI